MTRNTTDNIFMAILVSISTVLISNVSATQANGENRKVELQPNIKSDYSSNNAVELTEIQKITLRNNKNQLTSNIKAEENSIEWEGYDINFW